MLYSVFLDETFRSYRFLAQSLTYCICKSMDDTNFDSTLSFGAGSRDLHASFTTGSLDPCDRLCCMEKIFF
jgi:hypothetical protein